MEIDAEHLLRQQKEQEEKEKEEQEKQKVQETLINEKSIRTIETLPILSCSYLPESIKFSQNSITVQAKSPVSLSFLSEANLTSSYSQISDNDSVTKNVDHYVLNHQVQTLYQQNGQVVLFVCDFQN